ncbi:MAG TPA: alginate lyase family protein [Vicinamibacteria bacterium]|nr:alginate lyase family protein [Vicinamibacteria bacterium]
MSGAAADRARRPPLLGYAAAVRHLGPRQAWRNLVHRLWRRRRGCRAARAGGSDLAFAGRGASLPMRSASARLEGDTFTALGRSRRIGDPPDWNAEEPLLWLFNLHYFDYLEALPPERRVALVLDWIARHPPRPGAAGWMPYPLSLRLRNWTRLLRQDLAWPEESRARVLASIEAQGNCLAANVEEHLRGNHLLENGLTLALLSASFRGRAAVSWGRRGRAILEGELDEQFLRDGGHFERSPMYHALLTAGLVELAAALPPGDVLGERIRERLPGLLGFLLALRHPDGGIALFNDSALDIAPEAADLQREVYALRLDAPASERAAFPETGYWVWRGGGDALLVDAGPIGPDYVPAHAHGDIFSFELSLGGRRVVVDGGTSTYEAGAERDWVRSTRAHNTVEVDGMDQCEFFDAFRVGRRGRPHDVRASLSPAGLRLEGWHDAYRRLPGGPRHRRELLFRPPGVLLVWDRVDSGRDNAVVARVRFAPGLAVASTDPTQARVDVPGRALVARAFGALLEVEPGHYAPRFGERQPCRVLALRARANQDFGLILAPVGLAVTIDAAGAQLAGERLTRGISA